ncbi:peptidase S9 prolyl oligopeptidase active site domain-containing protein [Candidatus Magnetoovum chiemensis]|nr:peptidase S9 prolyl oligopeptidase active site domain-containing protein [Candidatus Magnetoovum chiemensis]
MFSAKAAALAAAVIALAGCIDITVKPKDKGADMAVRQIELKDFFRNPQNTGYQISPDGKHISYRASYERRLNIFVMPIDSNKAKRITSVTDRDILDYFWKGSDYLIFFKDLGGDENDRVYAVDRNGAAVKDLTPFDGVKAKLISSLSEHGIPDGEDNILIGLNKRKKDIFDVYKLNIKTGQLTMTAQNPGNITQWIADHKGRIRGALTVDGVNTSVYFRQSENEPFKTVITTNFKETLSPEFFTFDDKSFYALSNLGRDKVVAVVFDPASAKETELLYENPDVDIDWISFSKKRNVLLTAGYATWKRQRHFFDSEIEKVYARIASELPQYEVNIADTDDNENTFIVRTYSDRSLGAYYIYEKDKDKLRKLSDVSPWLREDEMAEMKPVTYKTRDGLTIQGYLTIPKGVNPINLPLVVNPHGGPWRRDAWGFNPEAQFLANRGYAVFQMNFRGSTGYGRKFWEASFKQWGMKMQDDITDGVKWLIDSKIADEKRICIYGASYGGYATLAALTFSTPKLYACAVDYVGISNLFTFLNTIPPYWKPYLDMMYEMVGNPETDKELLENASPVFHADRIKAPLLVAQGREDPRVNINESDQIVDALRKRGIAVEYIVKDNEGHGFINEENRFDFYSAMESFLSKHLK